MCPVASGTAPGRRRRVAQPGNAAGHHHGRGRHLRQRQVDIAAHDQSAHRAHGRHDPHRWTRHGANVPGEALRRGIGYVIQGNGLFPHWTVARNVATVPDPARSGTVPASRRRVHGTSRDLLRLDPATLRRQIPARAVGWAAAACRRRTGASRRSRAVLLMDEPFGALDPVIRAQAQTDLLALQKRASASTVVLVTHDMSKRPFTSWSPRIAVMDGGKVLQFATPAEILTNPRPNPGFVSPVDRRRATAPFRRFCRCSQVVEACRARMQPSGPARRSRYG